MLNTAASSISNNSFPVEHSRTPSRGEYLTSFRLIRFLGGKADNVPCFRCLGFKFAKSFIGYDGSTEDVSGVKFVVEMLSTGTMALLESCSSFNLENLSVIGNAKIT